MSEWFHFHRSPLSQSQRKLLPPAVKIGYILTKSFSSRRLISFVLQEGIFMRDRFHLREGERRGAFGDRAREKFGWTMGREFQVPILVESIIESRTIDFDLACSWLFGALATISTDKDE